MTSKEIIKNHIASLKEQAQIEKEQKTGNEVYCETDIEQYNQVLKDLDELEELKKIMGTPIQDIMKRLKVLDQLKEILSMDYLVRVYDYEMAKRLQTYLKSNDIVKEWLDGKNNL